MTSSDPNAIFSSLAISQAEERNRNEQIASIANAESIGSSMFFAHVGLLGTAGICVLFLFDAFGVFVAIAIYCAIFSFEKWFSMSVAKACQPTRYKQVLAVLVLRAVAYNVLVPVVWFSGDDVFKFGAMTLLIVATINIFVFHSRYPIIIACIVPPIGFAIGIISISLILRDVWSPESAAVLIVLAGLVPYVFLTLRSAYEEAFRHRQTQEALLHSQKQEVLGQLVAGTAHDFNNILAVTLGNAELLSFGKGTARSDMVDEIIKAAERGSSLTRKLLSFARKSHLKPMQLNVAKAVSDLEKILQRILPETIVLKVDLGNHLPDIYVDQHQLDNALLNLAINARDAMPHGGVLTIAATEERLSGREEFISAHPLTNKHYVKISMADTGHGVDQVSLAKIFDPYFTTKSAAEGSGLGLSAVIGFAEQSGGNVQFFSRSGEGSTVTIFLPMFRPEDTPDSES